MAENPGDLNLPLSVVSRIISDALPANTMVSMETRKAIAKAASVFVLYATASAAGQAAKRNRKTTTAGDVLEGVEEMEFTQFLPALKKSLETFRQNQKPKKPGKSKKADDADDNDIAESTEETTRTSPKGKKSHTSTSSADVAIVVSDDTD